jgi:hypothetical protein
MSLDLYKEEHPLDTQTLSIATESSGERSSATSPIIPKDDVPEESGDGNKQADK